MDESLRHHELEAPFRTVGIAQKGSGSGLGLTSRRHLWLGAHTAVSSYLLARPVSERHRSTRW